MFGKKKKNTHASFTKGLPFFRNRGYINFGANEAPFMDRLLISEDINEYLFIRAPSTPPQLFFHRQPIHAGPLEEAKKRGRIFPSSVMRIGPHNRTLFKLSAEQRVRAPPILMGTFMYVYKYTSVSGHTRSLGEY